ncbi:hypothetical protein [Methylobacillus sp.]|uniref:hypothetical protein n=1 Tax=Methylobacillus sp. TaxID=56818 RepID=UPI0012CE477F|nr:hypothetical protein [Methylobacillus sp.]MPS48492.1 hypothetical protein [Methylobacillus sp.]
MAFFSPKSVDAVLSGFAKNVADLRLISSETSAQAKDCSERAAALVSESNALLAESERASNATDRIEELFGDALKAPQVPVNFIAD